MLRNLKVSSTQDCKNFCLSCKFGICYHNTHTKPLTALTGQLQTRIKLGKPFPQRNLASAQFSGTWDGNLTSAQVSGTWDGNLASAQVSGTWDGNEISCWGDYSRWLITLTLGSCPLYGAHGEGVMKTFFANLLS